MIRDIQQIESDISTRDGSCRDINIEDISFERTRRVLDCLNDIYQLKSAVNSEGEDITSCVNSGTVDGEFGKKKNSIHSVFHNEEALITNMQVLLAWNDSKKVFVEFTFFPEDVCNRFSFNEFVNFISPFITASGSKEYFVRYENASWEYGDISLQGGVIYHGKNCEQENYVASL